MATDTYPISRLKVERTSAAASDCSTLRTPSRAFNILYQVILSLYIFQIHIISGRIGQGIILHKAFCQIIIVLAKIYLAVIRQASSADM